MTPAQTDSRDSAAEIARALVALGLASEASDVRLEPLTGGVSSDIWRADIGNRSLCVKRALPRLRVSAVWEAPIERNAYEVEWMRVVRDIVPDAVPELLAHDPGRGLFAMAFLPPARYPLWKKALMAGRVDVDLAAAVGRTIGRIHAATAARPELAAAFDTDDIFRPIRIEPYLLATAELHPDLREALGDLARTTGSTHRALVHGDVSPKNILAGPRGPVILDAECAWWGDPAFDLAFCLNHLLLKCIPAFAARSALAEAFAALAGAYLSHVAWEPAASLEARAARLLPGLFLGRVDGKSPAEYLTDEADKDRVRRVAGALLRDPVDRLAAVSEAWQEELDA